MAEHTEMQRATRDAAARASILRCGLDRAIYGLSDILSEGFTHGRRYGTVKVRNPFIEDAPA